MGGGFGSRSQIAYEVVAGNTSDSTTLKEVVETMEQRQGAVGSAGIADRGMASRHNFAWLRETGRRCIIGAPKSDLKKCRKQLEENSGWHELREGVEVKLFDSDVASERFILCRSADPRSQERAMHEKFSQRIETALERLQSRIAHAKKPLDTSQVERQMGRPLQRNSRAASRRPRLSLGGASVQGDAYRPVSVPRILPNTRFQYRHRHGPQKVSWNRGCRTSTVPRNDSRMSGRILSAPSSSAARRVAPHALPCASYVATNSCQHSDYPGERPPTIGNAACPPGSAYESAMPRQEISAKDVWMVLAHEHGVSKPTRRIDVVDWND